MNSLSNLTVVVPFWNGHATIERLLDSIAGIPVVVVDDYSVLPLNLNKKKYPGVQVIRPAEKGYFAGAVNAGIQATSGDVLVLNQDTWFDPGAFAKTVERWAELPEHTAIAGDGVFGHPAWPKGYVQGTLMFLRRATIDDIGLLNGRDYPLWGCTAEWQLRALRKPRWKARPWADLPGFHHERAERGKDRDFGDSIQQLLREQPEQREWFIRTPPAVSVIIPTYNHGKFLPDAVASLIGGQTTFGVHSGQTFQSFEIIIVDDGSTDETPEIGRALADDWTGVRYIRRANGGTPAANNTGIQAAYGKYITILCADDLREAGSLERLYRASEANPHSLVYDDVLLKLDRSGRERVWEMADYDFDRLLEKNFIHAGIMAPRKAFAEIGGYPEGMRFGREDWAVNVALGIKGYCGIHVKEAGYIYRRHDANRTLTNSNEEWRAQFQAQMRALFPEVYQGVRPMACCGKSDPLPGGGRSGELSVSSQSLVGADGMTLVSYQGGNYGNESYYGPVTGQRYIFSKSKPLRLVDDRDLIAGGRGLLEMVENERQLFVRAFAPPPPPAEPIPAEIAAGGLMDAPAPVAPKPDDLTKINGVGAATAGKLAQMGFTTYKAVAGMSATMAVVLGIPEARLQKIIDGAKALADG